MRPCESQRERFCPEKLRQRQWKARKSLSSARARAFLRTLWERAVLPFCWLHTQGRSKTETTRGMQPPVTSDARHREAQTGTHLSRNVWPPAWNQPPGLCPSTRASTGNADPATGGVADVEGTHRSRYRKTAICGSREFLSVWVISLVPHAFH